MFLIPKAPIKYNKPFEGHEKILFDTDGKKAESIFQLYGQSFDKVKKYIDNIAFMRNVSYDGINNLPDLLLKNLSNTLGLDSVNLIDQTGFDNLLYTKTSVQYPGKPSGISIVEAEYEFYRRLLVNLAHIYKSKGTRKSIEFFLKFLGAPEPMIKIDQYVYKVTSFPKSFDLEGDIYDAIAGSKTYGHCRFCLCRCFSKCICVPRLSVFYSLLAPQNG